MGKATYPRVNGAIFIPGAFERDGIVFLPRKFAERILGFPGWNFQEIRYHKRSHSELSAMRREFVKSVRRDFLKFLALTQRQILKEHGFSDEDFDNLAQGRAPKQFQVHHIIPLDDLGTNAFGNLILIRVQEHSVLTAYQNAFSRSLAPGDVVVTDFPVPPSGQAVSPPPMEAAPLELELWSHAR